MKATMYCIEIEDTPMEIAELMMRIETWLNNQARVTNPTPFKAPPWWVISETTKTTVSTGKVLLHHRQRPHGNDPESLCGIIS